jgi:hypothetical protein
MAPVWGLGAIGRKHRVVGIACGFIASLAGGECG